MYRKSFLPGKVLKIKVILGLEATTLTWIRIGPDRAYPLHFTRPQLLLLLPVLLLPVLLSPIRNCCCCLCFSFTFLGPILWNDHISAFNLVWMSKCTKVVKKELMWMLFPYWNGIFQADIIKHMTPKIVSMSSTNKRKLKSDILILEIHNTIGWPD